MVRVVFFATVVLVTACGDSDVGTEGQVVGASCTTSGGPSGSCADGSKCVVDSDFPDGSCVKDCDAQADCPGGSVCIQENSGLCVLAREDPAGSAKVCILQ